MVPAFEKVGPANTASIIPYLTPKIMVVGESLTLGTIGSRIYWVTGRTHRCLWGAVMLAAVMIAIAFGPLHSLQTSMVVELASSEPSRARVRELNGKTLRWLAGMTGLMLVVIAMMTGIRGLLRPLL